MNFIIGKKKPMTQIWIDDRATAVTPVAVDSCLVTQIKSPETDGYHSLQISSGQRKEKNIKKPQKGHFKLAGVKPAYVREFRLDESIETKVGEKISLESFSEGETVNVRGISKGKGFQGVVKRHGFSGGNKSHGNKDQLRMPGSIGTAGEARVFKGKKMPGRLGGDKVAIKNLSIVKIDFDNQVLFIKGALPGAVNSWVMISGQGQLKFVSATEVKDDKESKKETIPEADSPTSEKPSPTEKKEEKKEEKKDKQ